MTALFSRPQKIPTPQPVPTIDQASEAQDYTDQIRRRRGAASTVLVGGSGQPLGNAGSSSVLTPPPTTSPVLG